MYIDIIFLSSHLCCSFVRCPNQTRCSHFALQYRVQGQVLHLVNVFEPPFESGVFPQPFFVFMTLTCLKKTTFLEFICCFLIIRVILCILDQSSMQVIVSGGTQQSSDPISDVNFDHPVKVLSDFSTVAEFFCSLVVNKESVGRHFQRQNFPQVQHPLFIYLFIFNILFIYLFIIFGCVGSSFLCEGFLQLRQAGATLHRGARTSHYRGLSCCGAQAPDAQAQQLWLMGPVAPWHVGSSQTRA